MSTSVFTSAMDSFAMMGKGVLVEMALPIVSLVVMNTVLSYAMKMWKKRREDAPISQKEIDRAYKRMKNPTEKQRARQKQRERNRLVNREARRRMQKEESDRIRNERERRAGGHVVDPSYAAWYWGTYQGTARPADQCELDQVEAWADEDAEYNPLDPDAGQSLDPDWFEGLQEPEEVR